MMLMELDIIITFCSTLMNMVSKMAKGEDLDEKPAEMPFEGFKIRMYKVDGHQDDDSSVPLVIINELKKTAEDMDDSDNGEAPKYLFEAKVERKSDKKDPHYNMYYDGNDTTSN